MLTTIIEWLASHGIAVLAGGAAMWIGQNGWGKFLALYHARIAAAKTQTDAIYSEITGQVKTAVAAEMGPIKDAVTALKGVGDRVAALEQQLKAPVTIKPVA